MLQIEGLSRHFGGVFALRDVALTVTDGELRAVIGANGAGKSTLFHLISGHLWPDGGRIALHGRPIERLPRSSARGAGSPSSSKKPASSVE